MILRSPLRKRPRLGDVYRSAIKKQCVDIDVVGERFSRSLKRAGSRDWEGGGAGGGERGVSGGINKGHRKR